MTNSELKSAILQTIRDVAHESRKELVSGFCDDTVLLESGLDSLDFAIIVARLEQYLNLDPFSNRAEPVYPETFADFVGVYQQSLPDKV